MNEEARELTLNAVDRLRLRAHRSARAQYLTAKRDHAKHLLLGVPATTLTAIVSTAIFASLKTEASAGWITAAGVMTAFATLLTALQTFFGFGDRSAKHRESGGHYAALKRELDILRLGLESSTMPLHDAQKILSEHTDTFSEIEQASPDVPDRIYDRARQEQASDSEGV